MTGPFVVLLRSFPSRQYVCRGARRECAGHNEADPPAGINCSEQIWYDCSCFHRGLFCDDRFNFRNYRLNLISLFGTANSRGNIP